MAVGDWPLLVSQLVLLHHRSATGYTRAPGPQILQGPGPVTCLLMRPSADPGKAFTIVCRKHFLGTLHLGRGLTSLVALAISSGGLDLAGLGNAGRLKVGNQLPSRGSN